MFGANVAILVPEKLVCRVLSNYKSSISGVHDDVIKCKHFLCYFCLALNVLKEDGPIESQT